MSLRSVHQSQMPSFEALSASSSRSSFTASRSCGVSGLSFIPWRTWRFQAIPARTTSKFPGGGSFGFSNREWTQMDANGSAECRCFGGSSGGFLAGFQSGKPKFNHRFHRLTQILKRVKFNIGVHPRSFAVEFLKKQELCDFSIPSSCRNCLWLLAFGL
jgi:hypothetical protein